MQHKNNRCTSKNKTIDRVHVNAVNDAKFKLITLLVQIGI